MHKEMGMVEEKLTGIVKDGGGSLVWKIERPNHTNHKIY